MASGLFGTLNIANSGLSAQQAAIDTTSHNISNANTDGYTRQRVVLQASEPYATPSFDGQSGTGQMGTGVDITSIQRIRDSFLDYQIRTQNSIDGQYSTINNNLGEVQNIFNEPSDTGISSALSSFFSAWQSLSTASESDSARKSVVQETQALTDQFNSVSSQLSALKSNIQLQMNNSVTDLNSTINQINSLNKQIMDVSINGDTPNDLMDRRDLLLDNLSSKFGITITNTSLNGITVTTSDSPNVQLVPANNSSPFSYSSGSITLSGTDASGKSVNVTPFNPSTGAIQGYISSLQDIDNYSNQLDSLAKAVALSVNAVSSQSNTFTDDTSTAVNNIFVNGDDFKQNGASTAAGEDSITAANITINPNLLNNASLIQTGVNSTSGESDGNRALAVAQIADKLMNLNSVDSSTTRSTLVGTLSPDSSLNGVLNITSDSNGMTLDTYFQDTIDQLGTQTQEAQGKVTNTESLLNSLKNNKESVSGVSLDEEATNLIQYQHAYAANAKVISTVDQLLDVIVNGLMSNSG